MSVMFLQADAGNLPIADESVHCCITSPPYWGLFTGAIGGRTT